MRLGDVLDYHGNIEVPSSYSLIIRCRHKPSILVDEGDGVDRTKMLIVLLSNFARIYVILKENGQMIVQRVGKFLTCMIFLSDIPAKNMCCLSSSG